jgi:hypothetical protein
MLREFRREINFFRHSYKARREAAPDRQGPLDPDIYMSAGRPGKDISP